MFGGWPALQRVLTGLPHDVAVPAQPAAGPFRWTMRPVKWLLKRPAHQVAGVGAFLRDAAPGLLPELLAAIEEENLDKTYEEACAALRAVRARSTWRRCRRQYFSAESEAPGCGRPTLRRCKQWKYLNDMPATDSTRWVRTGRFAF